MTRRISKYDVLIADDHVIFRLGFTAMLQKIPSIDRVHEAANGTEALSVLEKKSCAFVFMDIRMPGMDGIAATKAIAEAQPATHVIAMSVYDDERYLNGMVESGAAGYLLKNTDRDEVEQAMRTVLSGKPYYAKSVSDKLATARSRRRLDDVRVNLTTREKQLLYCVWQEMSCKEIAQTLCLSVKSVELYRSRLLEKTKSKNIVSLAKYALQHGIVAEMEQVETT